MLNGVTMKINVDDYIINTLKEDITSEDVTTNAVMPENKQGKANLICKQDGIVWEFLSAHLSSLMRAVILRLSARTEIL